LRSMVATKSREEALLASSPKFKLSLAVT